MLNISVFTSGLAVHREKQQSGLSVHQEELQSGLSKVNGGQDNIEYELNETARKILSIMHECPMITYDELSIRLGKARSGIAKQIKKLIEANIIESKEKNGQWVIKKQGHQS